MRLSGFIKCRISKKQKTKQKQTKNKFKHLAYLSLNNKKNILKKYQGYYCSLSAIPKVGKSQIIANINFFRCAHSSTVKLAVHWLRVSAIVCEQNCQWTASLKKLPFWRVLVFRRPQLSKNINVILFFNRYSPPVTQYSIYYKANFDGSKLTCKSPHHYNNIDDFYTVIVTIRQDCLFS